MARGPDEAFGAEARLPITGGREVAADMTVTPDGQAVAVSAADGALRWWRGPASAGGVGLAPLPALGTAERLAPGVGSPQVAAGDAGDALSALDRPGPDHPHRPDRGRPGRRRADHAGRRTRRLARAGRDGRRAPGGRRLAVGGPRGGRRPAGAGREHRPRGRRSRGAGVPANEPPALAMDTAGDGLVLWARRVGGRSVIERAQYASP